MIGDVTDESMLSAVEGGRGCTESRAFVSKGGVCLWMPPPLAVPLPLPLPLPLLNRSIGSDSIHLPAAAQEAQDKDDVASLAQSRDFFESTLRRCGLRVVTSTPYALVQG